MPKRVASNCTIYAKVVTGAYYTPVYPYHNGMFHIEMT